MNRGSYALSIATLLALMAPGASVLAQSAPPPAPVPGNAGVSAQAPGGAMHVPWSSLSPDQQRLLSGFSGNWASLPAQRQQALANGSNRWVHMTPDQRVAARDRFRRWQALPPEQRQLLRQRWQQFRSLPPDRQRAVRENFRKFESLPLQRRQALRQRWQAASPAERQQLLQQARQRSFERQQMRQQQQMRQGARPPMRQQQMRQQQMRRRDFPGPGPGARGGSFGRPRARPFIPSGRLAVADDSGTAGCADLRLTRTRGNRDIADVDASRRYLVPGVPPIATRLDERGESAGVSSEHLEM